MNSGQLERATKNRADAAVLVKELTIWHNKLCGRSALGYATGMSNFTQFHNTMADGIFDNFREACIRDLEDRITVLDEEFENI